MKNKKLVGISLVVSAITMLLTLFVAPSNDKKTARFLSAIALVGGLIGALMACEQAMCHLKKKAIVPDEDEDELLFDEDSIEDVSVIHAESEDAVTILHCDVPCDEDATEADFV